MYKKYMFFILFYWTHTSKSAVNNNSITITAITAPISFKKKEKLFSGAFSYIEKLQYEETITPTSTIALKEALIALQNLASSKDIYAELAQEQFHSDEELKYQHTLWEEIKEHQTVLQNIHPTVIDWLLKEKKTKQPTKQSINKFPQTERNSSYSLPFFY